MNKEKLFKIFIILFYVLVLGITAFSIYSLTKKEDYFYADESVKMAEGSDYNINLPDDNLTYEINDETIATVDSKGNVKALKEGTATIKVKNKKGEVVHEIKLEVEKNEEIQEIELESIALNINDLELLVGDEFNLFVTYNPEDASNKSIEYKSDNIEVASITKDGLLKVLKTGTTNITVTSSNGKTDTCKVTVKNKESTSENTIVEVTKVNINKNSISLYVGDTSKLIVQVLPNNANNKNVAYSSSNSGVASVNASGKITALKEGNTIITVTSSNGISNTCNVEVKKKAEVNKIIEVNSISLNKNSLELNVNDNFDLKVTITPSDATNKNISYSSSNSDVVRVDSNGRLTALKIGKTTIVAKSNNGKTTSCEVKVISSNSSNSNSNSNTTTTPKVEVSSISLDKTSLNMKKGDSSSLKVSFNPSNASNKTITYSSSNSKIVTVDSKGNIKAVGLGTATITAKSNNGKTATCNISVSGVKLDKNKETAYMNSTSKEIQLTASVYPEDQSVTWSSDNTDVATVNANGKVTYKGIGTATISATSNNNTDKYVLTVKKKVIIIIGASGVARMDTHVDTYTSENSGFKYKKSNKTLNYVYKSGSGKEYQIGTGWTKASKYIDENNKQYIDYYIFFQLAGNDIVNIKCENITNENYKDFVDGHSSLTKEFKNNGYSSKTYIVSIPPVANFSLNTKVVKNTDKHACSSGYRSNVKYYKFNKTIQNSIRNNNEFSKYLIYEDLFTQIMNIGEDENENYSYNVKYNTSDGIHWDTSTTKYYIKLMLNSTKEL